MCRTNPTCMIPTEQLPRDLDLQSRHSLMRALMRAQLNYLLTRPSIQFHLMHLMAPGQLTGLIESTLQRYRSSSTAPWSCAVGIHLCGALSPRLIYEFGESQLDSIILSPCCLKGWIGKEVQQRAKRQV